MVNVSLVRIDYRPGAKEIIGMEPIGTPKMVQKYPRGATQV